MGLNVGACLVTEGGSFRIEAELGNDSIVIRPSGLINEDVNFGNVVEFINGLHKKHGQMLFDLGGISRINSCGVREWLIFLQWAQSRYRCSFVKANEPIIELASSIPSVLGKPGTPVDEIEAPFFCSKCDKRELFNLNAASCGRVNALTIPKLNCTQCKGPLEFDGIEEEYFSFLKNVFP